VTTARNADKGGWRKSTSQLSRALWELDEAPKQFGMTEIDPKPPIA
jgi:hypothetical protein